nr:MAG TPA: hypothetical protein [Caudoviricetes sp.]
MGLSNKSPKMKITPVRACSDRGEIVNFRLVRQPHFCCLSLIDFFSFIDRIISSIRTKFPFRG